MKNFFFEKYVLRVTISWRKAMRKITEIYFKVGFTTETYKFYREPSTIDFMFLFTNEIGAERTILFSFIKSERYDICSIEKKVQLEPNQNDIVFCIEFLFFFVQNGDRKVSVSTVFRFEISFQLNVRNHLRKLGLVINKMIFCLTT